MLSHVDRSRVITDEDGRIFSQLLTRGAGLGLATITLDGFLRGTWRVARSNKSNKGCRADDLAVPAALAG